MNQPAYFPPGSPDPVVTTKASESAAVPVAWMRTYKTYPDSPEDAEGYLVTTIHQNKNSPTLKTDIPLYLAAVPVESACTCDPGVNHWCRDSHAPQPASAKPLPLTDEIDWQAVGRIIETHYRIRGVQTAGTSNWGAAIWKSAHDITQEPTK